MSNSAEKFAVCGEKLPENATVLFVASDGNDVKICNVCKNHIDVLKSNNDDYELGGEQLSSYLQSAKYLNSFKKQIKNKEILINLKNFIDVEDSLIEKIDDENYSDQQPSSHWIKIMRIFVWITSVSIFIIGIILGINNSWNYSCLLAFFDFPVFFTYFIISFIIAFFTLAMTMIFLDMAQDIKAIRNNTEHKDK